MNLMTIEALLHYAANALMAVTDEPSLDAAILLAKVLHKPRSYLHAWPEKAVATEEVDRFMRLLANRAAGEPLAYILGKKSFWSVDLLVNSDTLIPRPETELLVETVLKRLGHLKTISLADLGTGSGAIALSLARERPLWKIHAVDLSEKALLIAEKNRARLALDRVTFHKGSWCHALGDNLFHVIVSNPPYIAEGEWPLYAEGLAFEPKAALVSGADGLTAIREIIQTAYTKLHRGGYLFLEHGYQQGEAVRDLFAKTGTYQGVITLRDLSGHERVTFAQLV